MSCSPAPAPEDAPHRVDIEPTASAVASSVPSGSSSTAVSPRPPPGPFSALLETAPPREVSSKLSANDAAQRRDALEKILKVYDALQALWERGPETCDLTQSACKQTWAEVARKLNAAEDAIPVAFNRGPCAFVPDSVLEETLYLTREHETFLRALVAKVRAELDARVAPSGIMSEQVWLKLVTRPKPGELPMPCLSCVAPASVRVSGPAASFRENEAALKPDDGLALAEMMKSAPASTVQLRGSADAGEKEPDKLALARANALKKYLVDRGIAAARIQVVSLGAEVPVGSSKTEAGRALNRVVWATPIKVR